MPQKDSYGVLVFCVLGIGLKALCILSTHSALELCSQPRINAIFGPFWHLWVTVCVSWAVLVAITLKCCVLLLLSLERPGSQSESPSI